MTIREGINVVFLRAVPLAKSPENQSVDATDSWNPNVLGSLKREGPASLTVSGAAASGLMEQFWRRGATS
jgi:hypothetical protein